MKCIEDKIQINERAVSPIYLYISDTFSPNKNALKCIQYKIKVQELAVSFVFSDTVSKIFPNPGQYGPPAWETSTIAFDQTLRLS